MGKQITLSRRGFLLGVASVAGLSLVSGCAPAAPASPAAATGAAGEGVGALGDTLLEVEFWHRLTGDPVAVLETFAAEFSAQNEGKIKLTSIAQGNIQELNQKIRAAAAGGGMPAATQADDYDVTQYYASNIIEPLDDYISDGTYGLTQEQIDDILPNQYNRHKLAIYEDKRMAFTQGFSGFTTFWNADALAAAGIENRVTNWDEFPDQVRTIAETNPDMKGWIIAGAGDRFISTLKTYGVEWLKEGGEESNFDAPETLEIMTWWRQLADEGLLLVDNENARNAFMAGECAYWMDSSGNTARFSAEVTAFQWDGGIPPQRTPSGSDLITETYGPVNALPKTTPEQQVAGWLWIKWLLQPENHSRYCASTNYFPATKSAIEDTGLAAYYDTNPTARRLVDEVAPYATILPPSPALTEVRGQITANVVNEVLLAQLSPEEGAKKLKAEADRAIKDALGG